MSGMWSRSARDTFKQGSHRRFGVMWLPCHWGHLCALGIGVWLDARTPADKIAGDGNPTGVLKEGLAKR